MNGWKTTSDAAVEDARIAQSQLALFPRTPREACECIGLNWLAACELYRQSWLSFDPGTVQGLNEAQETELRFVGSLVAAGCDSDTLARVLFGLRAPYRYHPGRIYLDWTAARWRLVPIIEPPVHVFSTWLREL